MKKYLLNKDSQLLHFLISILLVVVVSAFCYTLSPYIGYRVIALILLMTVSITAMFFDILPVLLSAILSAIIWNFFFIPPKFTFTISSTEDALMFMMYFVIATLNGVLTYKIRQMKKEAQERDEKENAIKLYNTLFNSLSHELQTPISTIIGATDTLKENEVKLSSLHKNELIEEISIASLRLNEQVENLLSISRLESGYLKLKKDWCDLNELVYSVINKLQTKLSKHHIEANIQSDCPLFKLDFGIMEQVFYNLLKNAIQYTPEGSTIYIEVSYTTIISGHFDQEDNDDESHRDSVSTELHVIVADTGSGFPDNEIEKVFGKFYRLRNTKAGGTGLGLSIVKGFIEAHGGTIRLRNNPNGGAEFTFIIPAQTSHLNALKNE